MNPIDQIQLNFNPAALQVLNLLLAVVMFGVALDLRMEDFRRVVRLPRAPMIGLACQFLLMPAFAFMLLLWLEPAPSIALGIMLVAACPGGNVSNFFTAVAGGNVALSVSMSAVSTLASIAMTPLNFMFWGRLHPQTSDLLRQIELAPWDIFLTVLTILIIPTILGMLTARYQPGWAQRLLRPMRVLSIGFLLLFIGGAFAANLDNFLNYIGTAFWIVLTVNAMALALGYWVSRLARLGLRDARAVAFETGIQNSAFGLLLIFNFFEGLGGMALIAAWWGVWHLISGLSLAHVWSRRRPALAPATA